METKFAPAERLSHDEIVRQNHELMISGLIMAVTESTNTYFMILNKYRQIIYANNELLDLINSTSDKVLGQRPGEILNCVNSGKTEGGCGTHEFCRECGAVNAIMEALKGIPSKKECRITSKTSEGEYQSYDLSVKAYPFDLDRAQNILVSVLDISDKKRRDILERTFFHDILNDVSGIYGASYLLLNKDLNRDSEIYERASTIYNAVNGLVEEIKSQQLLLAAETSELQLQLTETAIETLLESVTELVRYNNQACDCEIEMTVSSDITFSTDVTLLKRVLVNMVKNAAEASSKGEKVTVKAAAGEGRITFSVNNPKVMDEHVRRQVFQRSFSTKGTNRGIGTYSMKLLGENYLKGKVWFESSEPEGTTFYFELPFHKQ